MVKACPIYIDGEGVGNEVTGQRDLPRVRTNKVREGMLLVLCEGLTLKAPKILKYVDALKLNGWDFLKPFAKGAGGDEDKSDKMPDVKPSTKFISDVLAGRPIFSQPMASPINIVFNLDLKSGSYIYSFGILLILDILFIEMLPF